MKAVVCATGGVHASGFCIGHAIIYYYTMRPCGEVSQRHILLKLRIGVVKMEPAARAFVVDSWDRAWTEGLWAAAWSKSVEGLTPAQAAWSPGPGRNSIWQIVLHMCFWREYALSRAEGGATKSDEEIARNNFPAIKDASEAAWAATRSRFEHTQKQIAAGLRNSDPSFDRLTGLLGHDSYHIGQINTLRALQGLKAIE